MFQKKTNQKVYPSAAHHFLAINLSLSWQRVMFLILLSRKQQREQGVNISQSVSQPDSEKSAQYEPLPTYTHLHDRSKPENQKKTFFFAEMTSRLNYYAYSRSKEKVRVSEWLRKGESSEGRAALHTYKGVKRAVISKALLRSEGRTTWAFFCFIGQIGAEIGWFRMKFVENWLKCIKKRFFGSDKHMFFSKSFGNMQIFVEKSQNIYQDLVGKKKWPSVASKRTNRIMSGRSVTIPSWNYEQKR